MHNQQSHVLSCIMLSQQQNSSFAAPAVAPADCCSCRGTVTSTARNTMRFSEDAQAFHTFQPALCETCETCASVSRFDLRTAAEEAVQNLGL